MEYYLEVQNQKINKKFYKKFENLQKDYNGIKEVHIIMRDVSEIPSMTFDEAEKKLEDKGFHLNTLAKLLNITSAAIYYQKKYRKQLNIKEILVLNDFLKNL